jgi:hypothetical protein
LKLVESWILDTRKKFSQWSFCIIHHSTLDGRHCKSLMSARSCLTTSEQEYTSVSFIPQLWQPCWRYPGSCFVQLRSRAGTNLQPICQSDRFDQT